MNDIDYRPEHIFHNRLLRSLPDDVSSRLRPYLERIDAPLDMRLYDPYEAIGNVFFPVNSVASLVATTSSGRSSEIAIVGHEGAVGLDVLFGTDTLPHGSMIQIAGAAYRIGINEISDEFRRCEDFHDLILSFVQKLSVQISRTTLCNRLHTIDERLPRWLLMCHDRIDGDVLLLTQEFIAFMLGTSRVTVTQAARQFQNLGFIKYIRGRITILDRAGLESSSCDCYQIVKNEYDREAL